MPKTPAQVADMTRVDPEIFKPEDLDYLIEKSLIHFLPGYSWIVVPIGQNWDLGMVSKVMDSYEAAGWTVCPRYGVGHRLVAYEIHVPQDDKLASLELQGLPHDLDSLCRFLTEHPDVNEVHPQPQQSGPCRFAGRSIPSGHLCFTKADGSPGTIPAPDGGCGAGTMRYEYHEDRFEAIMRFSADNECIIKYFYVTDGNSEVSAGT